MPLREISFVPLGMRLQNSLICQARNFCVVRIVRRGRLRLRHGCPSYDHHNTNQFHTTPQSSTCNLGASVASVNLRVSDGAEIVVRDFGKDTRR